MPYQSQIIALAKGAIALHGSLKEVLFLNKNKDSILIFSDGTKLPVQHRQYGYDIRREHYALQVAAELGGTDPFSLLAFGYSGTGPTCYSSFLHTAGFKCTDVEDVEPPLKLRADGHKATGIIRRARGVTEISARSLDEARQKIEQVTFAGSCILVEEILCDGSLETKTLMLNTSSLEEAERMAKEETSSSSEILDVNVVNKQSTITEKVEAFSEGEAAVNAIDRVKPMESSYKSLARVSCILKPRKGLLGIGRKVGEWEAEYSLAQWEVTVRYRPPVTIRVHYGSEKLKCGQCSNVMTTTTDGVNYLGKGHSAESAILKLRCEKCDITRFEKRWEIDGEWIEWDDGSTMVL